MDSIKGMIHARSPSTAVGRLAAAVVTPVMERDDNRILCLTISRRTVAGYYSALRHIRL